MSLDAKVARFVSKLNPPMDMHLQSLRLTTFANVLDAQRLIEQEVSKNPAKNGKPQPKNISKYDQIVCKSGTKNPFPRLSDVNWRLPLHL